MKVFYRTLYLRLRSVEAGIMKTNPLKDKGFLWSKIIAKKIMIK